MVIFLIRWSLANRIAVLMLALSLILIGGYMTARSPIDVFPDLSAPTVTIIVEGHGMAAEEMETLVTFPIETSVNGATNVRRVRSATAVGFCVIWVEFDWGTEIYRARQTVTERLAAVTGTLPPQVDPPLLAPISSIMGEIMFISLSSPRHSPMDLYTEASTHLRRRLLAMPGVAQVVTIGGEEKQYQVVLSPQRLRTYNIGIQQVRAAMLRSNENVSAGILTQGGQETIVRGIGRIQSIEQIEQITVEQRDGRPIRIRDLGVVQIGPALKRGTAAASRRDEQWNAITEPAVIIAIQKQPNANTLALTDQLDTVLEEIQSTLPAGMIINKQILRQADFIQTAVHHTVLALRDGGLIVVLIVLLFLASFRASIITLLAIPISLLFTVLVLRLFGANINTMTLGGMAIAIGALVDDAIIDVENIVRRLRENATLPMDQRRSVLPIIYDASVEVRASIVFATLIIVLVFCPLFFLSGVEGRLLVPLGLAFCVALGASLVTALTVTPVLSYFLLPRSRTVVQAGEPWIVRVLKRGYEPVLHRTMNHPWMLAGPTIVLLFLAVFGLAQAGRNFLPEFNEGALVVGLVTLPGTSLQQSDELANLVQTTLMQHPEVVAIGRRTGRAEEDEHVQGVEASEIDLSLDMEAPARLGLPIRTKAELLEAMRADVAAIPGVQATFGQPISHRIDHMLSGTRASIAVKIFGEDLGKLRHLGHRVEQLMQAIPGVVDVSTEQQALVSTAGVEFDRQAIARFGLRIEDVAEALDTAFQGRKVSEILEGRNAFDLVLRLDREPDDLDSIGTIPVDSPQGAKVPMRVLANVYEDSTPNFISRENVQRKLVVMCNVADRDVTSVVADVRSAIAKQIDMPAGYYVEFGGQFESAAATQQRLAILGIVVILGIGFLLHMVLGSMRDALLVMVNLPLAVIGGVAGVYLAGGVITVASLIGFITVFGIAARNGILMVAHIRHLQQFEGVTDFQQAVHRGAMERLAPILMTALSAGLALVPLAMRGNEPGTEILTPMAIVILFGLLSSTFLNMVVLPALFLRFGARSINIIPVNDSASGDHTPAASPA